jgi:hypothetical protein
MERKQSRFVLEINFANDGKYDAYCPLSNMYFNLQISQGLSHIQVTGRHTNVYLPPPPPPPPPLLTV